VSALLCLWRETCRCQGESGVWLAQSERIRTHQVSCQDCRRRHASFDVPGRSILWEQCKLCQQPFDMNIRSLLMDECLTHISLSAKETLLLQARLSDCKKEEPEDRKASAQFCIKLCSRAYDEDYDWNQTILKSLYHPR